MVEREVHGMFKKHDEDATKDEAKPWLRFASASAQLQQTWQDAASQERWLITQLGAEQETLQRTKTALRRQLTAAQEQDQRDVKATDAQLES